MTPPSYDVVKPQHQTQDGGTAGITGTRQHKSTHTHRPYKIYHCIYCPDTTPIHQHAAGLHTNHRQRFGTKSFHAAAAAKNNITHMILPSSSRSLQRHYQVITFIDTQGAEETMTLAEKHRPPVFSQSELTLFSCHRNTRLTAGFHFTENFCGTRLLFNNKT